MRENLITSLCQTKSVCVSTEKFDGGSALIAYSKKKLKNSIWPIRFICIFKCDRLAGDHESKIETKELKENRMKTETYKFGDSFA